MTSGVFILLVDISLSIGGLLRLRFLDKSSNLATIYTGRDSAVPTDYNRRASHGSHTPEVSAVISTNELFNGVCIDIDGQKMQVVEFLHVKPGKGPAFVRAKLRNLRTGSNVEMKLNAGDKVPRVSLEDRAMEFLYRDGQDFVFMDNKNYEQISLSPEIVGAAGDLLKENNVAYIQYLDSEILGVNLPNFLELRIVETQPGARGDTVGNVTKPAKLETGGIIQVPLFVNEGDVIKIDTRSRSYIGRVDKA